MLTSQQSTLLHYIDARLKDGGVSPSFDEMAKLLGLRSKSGVHRMLDGLEERGFIRRMKNRSRAIEVIRLPGKAYITPSKMAEMVKAYDLDWQAEFFECLREKENA